MDAPLPRKCHASATQTPYVRLCLCSSVVSWFLMRFSPFIWVRVADHPRRLALCPVPAGNQVQAACQGIPRFDVAIFQTLQGRATPRALRGRTPRMCDVYAPRMFPHRRRGYSCHSQTYMNITTHLYSQTHGRDTQMHRNGRMSTDTNNCIHRYYMCLCLNVGDSSPEYVCCVPKFVSLFLSVHRCTRCRVEGASVHSV